MRLAIAPKVDVVLVVGALNSSNSNRLVEVARSMGTAAYLVPDESHLDPKLARGGRHGGRYLGGERARGHGGSPAREARWARLFGCRHARGHDRGRDVLAASVAAPRRSGCRRRRPVGTWLDY
ncbi:MAG: hypothetical protein ACRD1T_20045 [Acidimicrobiia bacterium]